MNHPFDRMLELHRSGYRQDYIWSCGPASVALCAHSLGFELVQQSVWLGPTLKPWLHVAEFPYRGMALHELAFSAEIIIGTALEAVFHRAYPENRERFFDDLKATARRRDQTMILNFTQDHLLNRVLEDHGNPHYSPVAGYNARSKQVLIADVDSEVTEAYSVDLKRVFEGMSFPNPALSVPRGWVVLRRR